MSEISEWYKAVNERMKSPFYWAFIFSWSIVNWRVFVIIFNSSGYPCPNGINECLTHYIMACGSWKYLLGYPILGSIIYVILVPSLDLCASWFKEGVIRNLYYKVKYDPGTLVSGEELARIQDELTELKRNRAEEAKELTTIKGEKDQLEREKTKLLGEQAKWKEDSQTIVEYFGAVTMRVKVLSSNNTDLHFDMQISESNSAAEIIFRKNRDIEHEYRVLVYRMDYPKIKMTVYSMVEKSFGRMDFEKKTDRNEETLFTGEFEEYGTEEKQVRKVYKFHVYHLNSRQFRNEI